jgi:hypothetical protein
MFYTISDYVEGIVANGKHRAKNIRMTVDTGVHDVRNLVLSICDLKQQGDAPSSRAGGAVCGFSFKTLFPHRQMQL